MEDWKIVKARFERISWENLIEAREASGQTVKEWCRSAGIQEHQYYYWLKKIRRPEPERIHFVEYAQDNECGATLHDEIEVQVPGCLTVAIPNMTIQIPNGTEPELAEAVLRALRPAC